MLCSLVVAAIAAQSVPLGPQEFGGAFVDPRGRRVASLGMSGSNTFVFQLNYIERRWKEEFIVVRPDPMAGHPTPYPVLALFHGYGETPQALLARTPLAAEAAARGWLVVIPTGAHVFNYGIDYAQDNIEDVVIPTGAHVFNYGIDYAQDNIEDAFEFVAQLAPLDLDRVYAIGFSMGGGAARTYAARHMDPTHLRVAAVVNHTGSTSLRGTYDADPATRPVFESPLMFGGAPSAGPFRYQRASSIDLRFGSLIDPETDMVRNLAHVPVIHVSATQDPLQYLVAQSFATHTRLLGWMGDSQWRTIPSNQHSWTTLGANILDDLAPLQLAPPGASGGPGVQVLADRDGRWHAFELQQARDKRFSTFTFAWDAGRARLELRDLSNIARLTFERDAALFGFPAGAALTLTLQARTAAPFQVKVRGFNSPPTMVERAGVPVSTWNYDAVERAVTLDEANAALGVTWRIGP